MGRRLHPRRQRRRVCRCARGGHLDAQGVLLVAHELQNTGDTPTSWPSSASHCRCRRWPPSCWTSPGGGAGNAHRNAGRSSSASWTRENRRGRTAADSAYVTVAGTPGFAQPPRQRVGHAPRLERRPGHLGRGPPGRRPGTGCRRTPGTGGDHARRRRDLPDPDRRRRVLRRRPGRHLRPVPPTHPGPADSIRAPHGRRCSTPGRRCTSSRTCPTWPPWPMPPPTSGWSGSCWTTAGSAVAATTPPHWATGRCRNEIWPDGLAPLVDHVTGAGHDSSGSGSNRR